MPCPYVFLPPCLPAVREMLSKHALVRSHASAPPREGGDGVTLVELAT